MRSALVFSFWTWSFLAFLMPTLPSVLGQEAAVADAAATESPAEASGWAADIEAFDSHIEAVRQAWGVPGLAVAIVKDDQVVLSKGYGVREVGGATAVDADTLFAIASNSKAFTAAGLAILVDEGKLSWDDPVADYLPWLKLKDPLATSQLTVRDLVCHRSGLGTFSGDLVWWGTDYSPRELLIRARELTPESSFRSQYGYSNLMFVAAGLVIEQVSGQNWGDFIDDRILSPLKMDRTVTSVRDLVSQGNYATPHKTKATGDMPLEWMNWDTMAAAGGIISSANDMSQWLRLQLRRGALPAVEGEESQRLFSERQSWEMWSSQMPIPVSAGYSARYPSTHFRAYGLGWSLSDYMGRKIVGHGGGYDGMYSQVVMVPEEGLGIVVLTNSMTGISPALTYHILDIALQGAPTKDWSAESLEQFKQSREAFDNRVAMAVSPAAEDTQPSHALADYAGTYRSDLYGDVVVSLEGDALVLKLAPHFDLIGDLEHLHYDTFVIRWRKEYAWFDAGTANFIANSRGKVVEVELDVPNDDLWFYELELKRVE